MIYQSFLPSPLVGEFVQRYQLLHFDLKGLSVDRSKTYYPHIEQCLTFDPRGRILSNKHSGGSEYRSYSYLSQQQTSAYNLQFEDDYLMLKVVFKPGALYRLLKIPLYEFNGQYVDAESVIPLEVKQVNEQLAHEADYNGMIGIVERYLEEKIKKVSISKHPVDRVMELSAVRQNPFSLDRIASEACLSNRQLERKYLERVGVTPVAYHRLIRFNQAFTFKEKNQNSSWFKVAVMCGYTDLQHLIKDFRQFTDHTPTSLMASETNSIERKLQLI